MSMAINDPLPCLSPLGAGEAPERPDTAEARPPAVEPALDSRALLQGGKAVAIRHNGELYRLQATRQGKLILTK
jgi:hemin uptake protein HemP